MRILFAGWHMHANQTGWIRAIQDGGHPVASVIHHRSLADHYDGFRPDYIGPSRLMRFPGFVGPLPAPPITGGVCAAGSSRVSREFVAFLDADDEWKPNHLLAIAALAARFPEAGGYAANHEVVSSDGAVSRPRLRELPPAPWEGVIPNFFRAMSIDSNPVWTSSFVVRREVLPDVGGFPPGVKKGQDKDLWVRIALRYPIAFTWKVGAVYHREAENRSDVHSLEEDRHYCRTLETELAAGRVPPRARRDVVEFVADTRLYLADKQLRAGNTAAARRILSRVATLRQLSRRLRLCAKAWLPARLVALAVRAKRRRIPGDAA